MSAGYVFQWLERIGLGYAVPNFMQLGVDTPQKLMLIDVKTYDALGIVDREYIYMKGSCDKACVFSAPPFSLFTQ